MPYSRALLAPLLGLCIGLAASPVFAQGDEERVNLIVSKAPAEGKQAKMARRAGRRTRALLRRSRSRPAMRRAMP